MNPYVSNQEIKLITSDVALLFNAVFKKMYMKTHEGRMNKNLSFR